VFLCVLIVFVLVSIHLDRGGERPGEGRSVPAGALWRAEDGAAVDLSEVPPGALTLTKDIRGLDLRGSSLCLKSIDTLFDVYADGRRIYSYRPDIPRRLGVSYGMYVHTVEIPEGTAELGLRLEAVFPGAPAALNDVVIGDGGAYMTGLFRGNLLAFAATVYLLVRAIRAHALHKELLQSLGIGLGAMILGVGVDIARYYSMQSYGSSNCTRLGVLVFTLLMGWYLFREQTRALRLKQQESSTFISELTTAFAKVIDMKDS